MHVWVKILVLFFTRLIVSFLCQDNAAIIVVGFCPPVSVLLLMTVILVKSYLPEIYLFLFPGISYSG